MHAHDDGLPEISGYRWDGPIRHEHNAVLASAPAVDDNGLPVTIHWLTTDLPRRDQDQFHSQAEQLRSALARHPNPFLVPLIDHTSMAGGRPVLVTGRYGTPASELTTPATVTFVRNAAATCANALDHLHRNNLLHRGVCPEAVLRDPFGRILLACPVLPIVAEQISVNANGTGHEPPEVLCGGELTPAGEVYSLASTVWALLAGMQPSVSSRADMLDRMRADPPTMPRQDVPESVVAALHSGLTHDPSHRPASAVLLAARLGDVAVAQQLDTVAPDNLDAAAAALGTRYVRVEELGSGAFGSVWRVRRRKDGAFFAAKVLHPHLVNNTDARTRLLRELELLSRLRHPHLVRVHEPIVDGVFAVVMDLVDGADLARILRERQIGRAEGLRLLSEVASALTTVHDADVVHRDIKPGNVLVSTVDGRRIARLTDFGIAKWLSHTTITQHGMIMGTYPYLAPEAVDATAAVPASDVYALGVMAYEVLTGFRPFRAQDPAQLRQQHATEQPVRPMDWPDDVWTFVAACLQKDPRRRPTADNAANTLAELSALVARTMLDPPPDHPPVPEPDSYGTHTDNLDRPEGRGFADKLEHSAANWRTDHLQAESPPPIDLDREPDIPSEITDPPTQPGTHPPPPTPVPARPRRWPRIVTLAGAPLLSLALGVGVWIYTHGATPPPESPPPANYQLQVTATVGTDGTVALVWPADANNLPGLQLYLVQRGKDVIQVDKGTTTYRDPAPGNRPCYRVIAYGVTVTPPPAPPPACVNTTTGTSSTASRPPSR